MTEAEREKMVREIESKLDGFREFASQDGVPPESRDMLNAYIAEARHQLNVFTRLGGVDESKLEAALDWVEVLRETMQQVAAEMAEVEE